MSSLYFRYGSMNSAKSMNLQAVAFNYHERDQRVVILKPTVDTKSPSVTSRNGMERKVDWAASPDDSILNFFQQDSIDERDPLRCILVDEAQFLTPKQVDELFFITVEFKVPVIAYGLRSDFRTHGFPGAIRLFELAHHIEEIKTICRCGKKAMFNGRRVAGEFVNEGSAVAIDGEGVTYESLCAKCFIQKVEVPAAK